MVSRATDGAAADGSSHSSSVSADGRFVAFASQADNLSGEDDNGYTNVFVRDLQSGSTTYISRATGGAEANGDSSDPSISADGRFVAFASRAENLSTEDMNSCPDWWWGETTACSNIFVRDLLTGTTTYVSRPADGTAANGGSYTPSISGDGTRVVFTSVADNLSAQDGNECYTSEGSPYPCANFLVRDLQAGSTTYLDVGSIAYGVELPCAPSISADGRFVAFESDAFNLSDDDVDTADTHTRSVYVRANGTAGAPEKFELGLLNSTSPKGVEVRCDEGEVALGGGHNIGKVEPNPPVSVLLSVAIKEDGKPVGWRMEAVEVVPSDTEWRPVVTVICAPAA